MTKPLALAAVLLAVPLAAGAQPPPLAVGMTNPRVRRRRTRPAKCMSRRSASSTSPATGPSWSSKTASRSRSPGGSTTRRGWPLTRSGSSSPTATASCGSTPAGKADVFAAPTAFPVRAEVPQRRGRGPGERHRLRQRLRRRRAVGGAVHRITGKVNGVAAVVDAKRLPGLQAPARAGDGRRLAPAGRRLRHRHAVPGEARRRVGREAGRRPRRRRRAGVGPLRPAVRRRPRRAARCSPSPDPATSR